MATMAVFGSESGIGRYVTEALVEEGHVVHTFDMNDQVRTRPSGEHTRAMFPLHPDHLNDFAHLRSVREAYITFGVPSARPFDETEKMREYMVMEQNFHSVAGALRALRQSSRRLAASVVLTASVSGLGADPGGAIYGASKAALISLTRSLAREWVPWRVNCVAPGPTGTAQFRANVKDQDWVLEEERSPHGRVIEPSEVASAMIALARQTGVSGVCLPVDLAGSTSTRRKATVPF